MLFLLENDGFPGIAKNPLKNAFGNNNALAYAAKRGDLAAVTYMV